LRIWETGDKRLDTRPWGNFSRNNWDDCIKAVNGIEKVVKIASKFIQIAEKLKPAKRKQILEAATAEMSNRRSQSGGGRAGGIASDSENEDFELIDDEDDDEDA
jgi:hypothetical protein